MKSTLLKGRRLGAIDGGLLVLVGHVAFAGVMFGPVYLDWIAAMGTSVTSSIAALWTLAAPAAGMAIGGPLFTWLERDFGVLRMLRLSCALIFLSGSMAMLAQGVWQLLLARALVGFAAAAMLVATTAIFRMRYPGGVWRDWRRRQDIVIAFSAVVGLFLVALLSKYGWRAPFLLHIVGFPAYVLVWWLTTRPGLNALVRRYEAIRSARMARATHTTRRIPSHHRPAHFKPLLWMLVLTMFVSMMHFFGLIQVVSAIIVTEWEQHAISVAVALTGLFAGTIGALLLSTKPTEYLGDAGTVAMLFALNALGFWATSHVQNLFQLTATMVIIGFGFGGLRPVLVAWFDRITRREHRSSRLFIAIPSYYLGVAFSPLFVLYLQDWRHFQLVCSGWMLVISAVYAGAWVRDAYEGTRSQG